MSIQSSHELYIILNENETLYWDKNRDFRLYKTKLGLKKHKNKYIGKKVAVFRLADVQEIANLFVDEEGYYE